jgi:membrane complex biogenesis BtpA family protein
MGGLLESLFGTPHPVLGMVHLHPLPGSPRWGGDLDAVIARAVADARALKAGGADGAVVENFGDAPFLPGSVDPACTAAMAVALRACVEATGLPFGVNVLRNDPLAALGVAVAGGGRFVRTNIHTGALLTDQGLLAGRAHETLRARKAIGAEHVAIFADILVKHATSLVERDPRKEARDAVERGLADAVLVTGPGTGERADFREVAAVRDELEGVPVLVGSGIVPKDLWLVAILADGVLVGTELKKGGKVRNPVDPARVRALVAAARKAW